MVFTQATILLTNLASEGLPADKSKEDPDEEGAAGDGEEEEDRSDRSSFKLPRSIGGWDSTAAAQLFLS